MLHKGLLKCGFFLLTGTSEKAMINQRSPKKSITQKPVKRKKNTLFHGILTRFGTIYKNDAG
ncbi:MAG: hypothetical protein K6G45_12470 [Lachnospiraceae bacterium]|nr:hypothetical protein [Lachnospiraceae bacterium]